MIIIFISFNNSKKISKNKIFLLYNIITIICYSFYKLLNSNYIKVIIKISKLNKILLIASKKIIEINQYFFAIKKTANLSL